MENKEELKAKLLSFVSLCNLFIFCCIVNRKYVGTSDFDKTQIVTDMEEVLSDIKLERQIREQLLRTNPDDLYRVYQNFISLLLADAQDWSFHLVVMFLNILPVDLKKLVVSQGYKLPRLGELSTAERQQHELEVLREATVGTQRSYVEEK